MSEARKVSKHTPIPWRADRVYCGYVWSGDKMVADFPMDEDEGTYLARMRGVGRGATHEEQLANAALIVLAVNNHAKLMEALEAVLTWEDTKAPERHWVAVVNDVRAALAAVKGDA